MTETTAEGTGTYLYGVAYAEPLRNGKRAFESTGIGEGGGQIRTVEYGDLAAVVSDAPLIQYDVTPENLGAHQRVLDEVMQRTDIVPVSFGIVATDDQVIKERLLERESESLHQSLEYVRGKVEVTLRVLWNQDQLFREIVNENPEVQQLRDALAGQPADAAYNERVRLGELTAAAMQAKSEQEGQAILDALQPLAAEIKVSDSQTDMMLLNAALLVDKGQLSAVDDKVGELSQARADRMIFQYVGPFPAYDFVSIRIQSEE
ncbi:MAG: GvpL/GvpF family gas vesicle protein [Chloroflexi bacterium]|nr:GvpL/GvpF family gas vesicle protein [Chloroflexota bacterium]